VRLWGGREEVHRRVQKIHAAGAPGWLTPKEVGASATRADGSFVCSCDGNNGACGIRGTHYSFPRRCGCLELGGHITHFRGGAGAGRSGDAVSRRPCGKLGGHIPNCGSVALLGGQQVARHSSTGSSSSSATDNNSSSSGASVASTSSRQTGFAGSMTGRSSSLFMTATWSPFGHLRDGDPS